MPKMDGSGPAGKGPMTGRGMGKCKDDEKKLESRGFGRRSCCRGRCSDSVFSSKDQE